ncbi:MAG: hypothetical protein Q7O66_00910 [Dehalococcoidia bacterium]|nr:hypothetical protein [Dehalococcoidia bacterium]
MSRVDELQKKYPSLPREIIVKWETLRHGIRDSDVLYKVGLWRRAAGGYQSLDHGVTAEEIAKQRPESVRPGYVLLPGPYYMKNGLGARIERDPASPYQIRESSPGRYALYEGEDKIEDVYFSNPRHWVDDPENEPRTSRGTPVTSLVTLNRRCFQIAPLRHCEYFDKGIQCKFCNYNSTHDQASAIGSKHAVSLNLDETLEAYKILGAGVRLIEGRYQSGGISSREKEANLHFRFAEAVAKATPYTPHLTLGTQPVSKKDLVRLRDTGHAAIYYAMEVWEPEIFAEVCPGKNQRDGFEGYKEACEEAVEVFGVGNVAVNLVGGVSLMAASGHKTWQESRDSMIEALRWLIKTGVFPTFHCVRLGAGSIYGDNRANAAKVPPTEYILDSALAHHELMKEYGRWETLDKLLACPLDCLAHFYAGEVGIVDVAGNPANWLKDTVPDDGNWLLKFMESTEATGWRPFIVGDRGQGTQTDP